MTAGSFLNVLAWKKGLDLKTPIVGPYTIRTMIWMIPFINDEHVKFFECVRQ